MSDNIEKLCALKKLLDDGAITREEFEKQKLLLLTDQEQGKRSRSKIKKIVPIIFCLVALLVVVICIIYFNPKIQYYDENVSIPKVDSVLRNAVYYTRDSGNDSVSYGYTLDYDSNKAYSDLGKYISELEKANITVKKLSAVDTSEWYIMTANDNEDIGGFFFTYPQGSKSGKYDITIYFKIVVNKDINSWDKTLISAAIEAVRTCLCDVTIYSSFDNDIEHSITFSAKSSDITSDIPQLAEEVNKVLNWEGFSEACVDLVINISKFNWQTYSFDLSDNYGFVTK